MGVLGSRGAAAEEPRCYAADGGQMHHGAATLLEQAEHALVDQVRAHLQHIYICICAAHPVEHRSPLSR